MLDQNLKNQLAQYLDMLKTEVTIGLSVSQDENSNKVRAVSYTHLTLPTIAAECRSRWSPYH